METKKNSLCKGRVPILLQRKETLKEERKEMWMLCKKVWIKINELRLKAIKEETSQRLIRISPRETIFAQRVEGWTPHLQEVGSNKIMMGNGFEQESRNTFAVVPGGILRWPPNSHSLVYTWIILPREVQQNAQNLWRWWDSCSVD